MRVRSICGRGEVLHLLLFIQTVWTTCDAKRTTNYTHIYIYRYSSRILYTVAATAESSLLVLFHEKFEGRLPRPRDERVGGGGEGRPTLPRKDTQSNNNYLLEGIFVVRLRACVCVYLYYDDYVYINQYERRWSAEMAGGGGGGRR